MKCCSILFALGILLWGSAPALSQTRAPVCLSCGVYEGKDINGGLTDLLTAKLSGNRDVVVVDRTSLNMVLGEKSLTILSEDMLRQVRVGRMLGIDYFLWVNAATTSAVVEVVEASTGRGVAVWRVAFEEGRLIDGFPAIAAEATRRAMTGLPPVTKRLPVIAFVEPFPSSPSHGTAVNGDVESLVGLFFSELTKRGVYVLPRRFARETVDEQWRREKGLVGAGRNDAPLLEAEYVLTFTPDEEGSGLVICLVEIQTGRRLGKVKMDSAAIRKNGCQELCAWVVERLSLMQQKPAAKPAGEVTENQNSIPETLSILYAGIVLHNEGRYLDAIPKFFEVRERVPQIKEIQQWSDSSYRLAGFPEIADMYAAELTNRPIRNLQPKMSLGKQAQPGVSVIGIAMGSRVSRVVSSQIELLLPEILHEYSGSAVLMAEDIAGLRDEYDLLLGLENAKGTTWQKAPPLLLMDAITVHIDKTNALVNVRLCRVRNCSPTNISDIAVALPADPTQWRGLLAKGAAQLFGKPSVPVRGWRPPALVVREEERILTDRVREQYKYDERNVSGKSPKVAIEACCDYLKLLSLNPTRTEYLPYCSPRPGVDRWFLRTLPKDHPDYPFVEFSLASLPIEKILSAPMKKLQAALAEFRRLSQKYPRHFIGLISRYNVVLAEMSPTNFDATQIEMRRIASSLDALHDRRLRHPIETINRMADALQYALGKSSYQVNDSFVNYSSLITVAYQDCTPRPFALGERDIPYQGLIATCGNYTDPDTPEKARLDLEAICLLKENDSLPISFLKGVVDKYGKGSDVTRYVLLKYTLSMLTYFNPKQLYPLPFNSKQVWSEEDTSLVISEYADAFAAFVRIKPANLSEGYARMMLTNIDRLPRYLAVEEAIARANAAIDEVYKAPAPKPALLVTAKTNALESAENLARVEQSWEVGPLNDGSWREYVDKKARTLSKAQVSELYAVRLNRFHELYDGQPKSHQLVSLYLEFASVFLRGGRYELAEPLLEQMTGWRDEKGRVMDRRMHVDALYLLANCKWRNKDSGKALQLAKEAITMIENNPKTDFSGLSSVVTALIKTLRDNPNAPFVNPYGKP